MAGVMSIDSGAEVTRPVVVDNSSAGFDSVPLPFGTCSWSRSGVEVTRPVAVDDSSAGFGGCGG